MLLRSVVLLILSVVTSATELDLDDATSVKNYFEGIAAKAVNDYQLNVSLTNFRNKRVLNLIFEDKTRVFDELANISANLRYRLYKPEWTTLMRTIVKNEVRGGIFDAYDLHSFEDELDALRKRIELSIEAFRSVGQLDDEDSVEYFCSKGYPLANLFLEQLQKESVYKSYINIIEIVRDKMKSFTDTQEGNQDHCGQSASFRKALYDYYQLFMLVHVKFVVLKFYNWATFTRCLNFPYRSEMQWVGKEADDTKKMVDFTKETLNNVNHYIYTCEPLDYERKYENIDVELKKMMRPVMINEKNISTTGNCNHRCDIDSINNARIYEAKCKEYRDCKYVSKNDTICSVEAQKKLNEYLIEDVSGVFYGYNDQFFNDTKSLHAEHEISDSACGFCFCTCVSKPMQSSQVTTALSFRDQVSDIDNNKVIGAVQFIEKDFMIQIQIMENELMPAGDTELSPWKPLDNFNYHEETGQYYVINERSVTALVPGVDYGHPEVMNLDDVIAPSGYAVTGVRFRFAGDSLDNPQKKSGPIQLQIRVTPFDYVEGKLIDLDKTHWIAPDSQNLRNELMLENPDHPSKSSINPPDSKANQFVRFKTSDWCKDSGAATVPFFNGQTVRFIPMTALGGVGIYHRGKEGYGGYLALRVFDLNLSQLLRSNL